ncbi:hypothetical protein [Robiginitalea marina]|uniref:6-bladed beta-propeller n=1 Tax=Robiginitalea marina TaxID=2954105 RepID=A0ABT1AXB0_9FLAO|nr:hypothetical protein [Robiginitalea marina]MCO5724334.1 hypothetical protein [Robiginitalea marina]
MLRTLFTIGVFLVVGLAPAQEIPLEYHLGKAYNDRHPYSNLLLFAESGPGGEKVVVRSYFSGLVLKPKGYLIERYNAGLELIDDFEYAFTDGDFVRGFVANGQLYLLFLTYDQEGGAYLYTVHQAPLGSDRFTQQELLRLPGEPVENPLDRNYYNRNFESGFTTTVLADPGNRAFAISVLRREGEMHLHRILVFDNRLQRLMDLDFSESGAEKNYAFEEMEVAPDLSAVYLVGKAYFRKRRFRPEERKFQYELLRLHPGGIRSRVFDREGTYSEALRPLWHHGKLICAGFYADRKDNRYNGIQYAELHPETLEITKSVYNPFSEQFMRDKFGQETDKDVRNLVFKGMHAAEDGSLLFNAEEYFMTEGMQASPSGGRMRVERFHHNDIVSVRLDASGRLEWARNINKTEVTQGDGAYVSYSSCLLGGQSYYFLCSSMEQPQKIGNDRLMFKQGNSRNRHLFAIGLDPSGTMTYRKLIDNKEARLPLMVSRPLIDEDQGNLFFYARKGGKKQLLSVGLPQGQ